MKRLFVFVAALFCSVELFAEPHMSATIQNMHLWRGGEVADGVVLTTDVCYANKSEHFKIGFWGGTNSTGEYKEFDYYMSYSTDNFSVTLFDTYNFSTYATYNNKEFFNYKVAETGRFIDATFKYNFGEKFPLGVSWATVIFGRDRDVTNSHNRYSTFCSAEYPVYKQGCWQIDTGIGAAFALNNIDDSANFYSDKAGVVEITIKVSKSLVIKQYQIPVSVMAMWNPQTDSAYLQLSIQAITF